VFAVALASSLAAWRAERKRGVWLAVPVHRTELLPAAISAGFELHHTEPDCIVLNQWLEDSASMMPGYTTHTAGVGAVVINARRQVLAIQEASGPASKMGGADGFWKYPTGLVGLLALSVLSAVDVTRMACTVQVEAGEGVAEAAVREVREECGIGRWHPHRLPPFLCVKGSLASAVCHAVQIPRWFRWSRGERRTWVPGAEVGQQASRPTCSQCS
jgi:ADP-ribose pyrophosphatase YjhB (NUDIX family)